jgi:hypothetical protein
MLVAEILGLDGRASCLPRHLAGSGISHLGFAERIVMFGRRRGTEDTGSRTTQIVPRRLTKPPAKLPPTARVWIILLDGAPR